jgi:quercetin dioxygenase-like cupin family protein
MYFLFESETAPGNPAAGLDVHAHARYDESEYVLTGDREIVIEEQRWHAVSGFFAVAPRHARHGMRTIGSEPSRWLHFFSPAEIERYFIEREHLRESDASADRLRALSQQYGVGDSSGQTPEAAYASLPETRHDGVVVAGRQTRNAYTLAERSTLTEHDHAHVDQEEAFYVISGELTLEVKGATLVAPARSFVLVPRGMRHRHISAPDTRLLAIYSPAHALPH